MSSKRRLSDWISAYLEYVENTEPPLSYHVWTAISTIAGALQRKVYMDWIFQRIFPNMYIVLVGPSGRCKKGTAMNLGQELMKKIPSIKLTANSTTREAVIKQMMNAESSFPDPDGNLNKGAAGLVYHSSLTVFSDELSVFLGQNDIKFLANLTDWYDSKDIWIYDTIGRGEEEVRGVCVNLIGGTAPEWFQSILPEEAIGGGFTSRIFFIVEESKRKTVAYHIPTTREKKLRGYLVEDLERINKLRGYYEFSEEALETYISWYESEDSKINAGNSPVRDPRFAGYCDRRATHIKKLGMVFASSRSDVLVIDTTDFERALDVMEKAEVKMPKAFSGLGSSDHVKVTDKIIQFLQHAPETVKKSTLLVQFFGDLDTATWELIRDHLIALKYISIIYNAGINPDEEEYKWTGPKD